MKLCIINSHFSMGGQEKVTAELGSNLRNIYGIDVFLYSFLPKKVFFEEFKSLIHVDKSLDDLKQFDRIRRKFQRKLLKKNLYDTFNKRLDNLANYLLDRNIDTIIVNGGFLTALIPYLKNRLPDIIIIAWQHSNANIYLERYHADYLAEYTKGLQQSNHVVCLTEHDKTVFSQYNNNVSVINNPVTIDNNKNEFSKLSNKNIAFISRYNIEAKGIDYLVKISSMLPDECKILFAGSGSEKEIANIKELIHKNHQENKIILLGALNNDELKKVYLESSLFISTSRWEGFGLSILEAMTFGLPIVSFDNSGPREITDNGKYGVLVEKYNVEKFCDEILNMFNNSNSMIFYQKKSLSRVKKYSGSIILSQWKGLLDSF
ncbi:glycosyltransferase [Enterococcus casseliflavus]|uniref:glycosyltransferase n=1 Tax=Enterococcus casseliflavus TaxID=37734 RepID=UPI0022E7CC10|nr:glycosyltransferase [Enterococcus casseliflavus]